jgi:hypothetical protein
MCDDRHLDEALSSTALRPSTLRFVLLASASFCLAQSAEAQADQRGRLEGTVTDSVHARPFAGVRVVALTADARPDSRRTASTDSLGRYRIDSLRPGRYLVGLESPLLDSLEITLAAREVAVTEGAAATADLALPPAAKLRSAVCSGVTLPADRGVLYGHAVDAATEAPLAGAVVTVAWRELTVDKTTLRSESNLRTTSVAADSAGWYRVCGVPTGTWLSFMLQHLGHSGTAIRTIVDDSLGIAIRHLSLDLTGPADDTSAATAPMPASGTARLTGVIRGPAGQPLSSAEVWVLGTNASTRSDESGQFTLGDLPAGTQVVGVRRVGYSPTEASFELRSHATANGNVRMERVVMLDSIRVVAMRNRYPDFERARKRPGGGRFIGPEEMQWYERYPLMSDVLRMFGFTIVGDGMFATPVGGHGASFGVACAPNVVINGVERQSINDVNPRNVGAMALRGGFGSGPIQYDTRCGLIEIWTKR